MEEANIYKNSSNQSGDLASTLLKLVWIALAIAVLIVALYFFQFHGELASTPEKWGLFGDYLGGVLNPVFSFFALLALLFTIVLQSRELSASREELKLSRKELANSAKALQDSKDIATRQAEHFETQARKEDVYRMINYVYEEIVKRRLSKNEGEQGGVGYKYIHPHGSHVEGLATYDALFGENKKENLYMNLINASEDEGPFNSASFRPFIDLLDELMRYLKEFELLSGDSLLTDYYKRRLRTICQDMHDKGYVDVNVTEYYSAVLALGDA